METHASLCSISVFMCARRTCPIPHIGTLCNRSVLSYSILAYPFISIIIMYFVDGFPAV